MKEKLYSNRIAIISILIIVILALLFWRRQNTIIKQPSELVVNLSNPNIDFNLPGFNVPDFGEGIGPININRNNIFDWMNTTNLACGCSSSRIVAPIIFPELKQDSKILFLQIPPLNNNPVPQIQTQEMTYYIQWFNHYHKPISQKFAKTGTKAFIENKIAGNARAKQLANNRRFNPFDTFSRNGPAYPFYSWN